MERAPKALRLHIALVGRMNVGKSTFLNLVTGQDVSITSDQPGTTTDVVEKTMELLPIGPVVFLDTAGSDDTTVLGAERVERTRRSLDRADVVVLIAEPEQWGEAEEGLVALARKRKLGLIGVVNKADLTPPSQGFLDTVKAATDGVVICSAAAQADAEVTRVALKAELIAACPEDFLRPPPLVGDLVRPGGLAVLVVPIDLQAPKGRLILPQVQTIRDTLDNDAATLVIKERELAHWMRLLPVAPDVVICDSQVVLKMVADTPPGVACTTFSVLFARLKGDLRALALGARAIDSLKDGDRVLIAESCSHHAAEDDIGRVKIPRWLRQYTGAELEIATCAGRDFPEDVSAYQLIVQCGGCMNNRREMLSRLERARSAGVSITNYGLCISQTQGVLKRILSPFPAALDAYESVAG